jgi:hypothetical protein
MNSFHHFFKIILIPSFPTRPGLASVSSLIQSPSTVASLIPRLAPGFCVVQAVLPAGWLAVRLGLVVRRRVGDETQTDQQLAYDERVLLEIQHWLQMLQAMTMSPTKVWTVSD